MAKFKTVSTQLFYDNIAGDYDSLMTESDSQVRDYVKELFKKIVNRGTVVDFGGGTGLDLSWLTEYDKVIFIEPSECMRAVAKKNSAQLEGADKIFFLEKSTSTNDWSGIQLPFSEKADGILMNFAVLNCVENPFQLFEKLQLICNKSCLVVATIINPQVGSVIKNYSPRELAKVIFHGRFTTLARYREFQQMAHVHSVQSLVRASEKYFEYRSYVPLNSSNFGVLILSKK